MAGLMPISEVLARVFETSANSAAVTNQSKAQKLAQIAAEMRQRAREAKR